VRVVNKGDERSNLKAVLAGVATACDVHLGVIQPEEGEQAKKSLLRSPSTRVCIYAAASSPAIIVNFQFTLSAHLERTLKHNQSPSLQHLMLDLRAYLCSWFHRSSWFANAIRAWEASGETKA